MAARYAPQVHLTQIAAGEDFATRARLDIFRLILIRARVKLARRAPMQRQARLRASRVILANSRLRWGAPRVWNAPLGTTLIYHQPLTVRPAPMELLALRLGASMSARRVTRLAIGTAEAPPQHA